MHAHTLALLLQFCVLNQQDFYTYTMPNIHMTSFTYHGQTYMSRVNAYGDTEANPMSAWLISKKIPDACFIGGCAVVTGAASLLSDFDNQHLRGLPFGSVDVLMTLLTLAEIQAIHSWARYDLGPIERTWTLAKFDF